MRRRSVSALSTAAVRLVSSRDDLGGVDLVGVGPEEGPGQRQLDAGDADRHPRGDEHQPDHPDGGRQHAPSRPP